MPTTPFLRARNEEQREQRRSAILAAGTDYYLSGTPGGICPRADVTTGDDPIRIGMALTTAHLQLDFADPDVTL